MKNLENSNNSISNVNNDKNKFRKACLRMRDQLSDTYRNQADEQIYERLINLDCIKESETFLVYVNYKSEVNTIKFIQYLLSCQKDVYCPLVEGEDMNFYKIKTLSDLQKGYFGILEPIQNQEKLFNYNKVNMDKVVMILPGAAFDLSGHRIGYGKAFYDRYLQKHFIKHKIGICYKEQFFEMIPYDDTDQIVTDIVHN